MDNIEQPAMTNEQPEQWAVDVRYLAKLADWAASQGVCQIEGMDDPDEWCVEAYDSFYPMKNGDGYTADTLADGLIASIQHAFTERTADLVADNAKLREALGKARKLVNRACEWIDDEDISGLGPAENAAHTKIINVLDAGLERIDAALAQQDTTDAK